MRSTLDIDPLGSFARGMLIVEILLCLLYSAVCIATNAPRAPTSDRIKWFFAALHESGIGRLCSLIPGFGVKLSAIILAGPTVLSAVGACPPHDGVRRRWWINVASAVSLMRARKKSGDLTTAIVPAGTSFPARAGTL
jgi:hypothetical protein